MTSDAQFALRRVIEKYTKNARFCLICNYVSKIIPALQSRCTRFRFAPLNPSQIRGRLEEVAKEENVPLTDDGAQAILDLSGGDMRRVLNLLQSTALSMAGSATATAMDVDDGEPAAGSVNETAVYTVSGSPLPKDIDCILTSLLNDQFRDSCAKICDMCATKGYALADVLKQLTLKLIMMDGLDSIPLGRLLDGMSQVECRLAMSGTEEKIQTASLVGVFVETRQLLAIK